MHKIALMCIDPKFVYNLKIEQHCLSVESALILVRISPFPILRCHVDQKNPEQKFTVPIISKTSFHSWFSVTQRAHKGLHHIALDTNQNSNYRSSA